MGQETPLRQQRETPEESQETREKEMMGFDPVEAFNHLLKRLDRIAEALEKIAALMEREKKISG